MNKGPIVKTDGPAMLKLMVQVQIQFVLELKHKLLKKKKWSQFRVRVVNRVISLFWPTNSKCSHESGTVNGSFRTAVQHDLPTLATIFHNFGLKSTAPGLQP